MRLLADIRTPGQNALMMKISRSNAISLVFALGFVWSIAALTFAATRYLAATATEKGVAAMLHAAPPAASRAVASLTDPAQAKLVEGELQSAREAYSALHGLLTTVVQSGKERTVTDFLLWLGPVGVFGTLLLGRRREVKG
jgi:hypothetical protein